MRHPYAVALAALALAACSEKPQPRQPAEALPVQAAPADDRPVIVAFGDSLTAGYGLEPGQSYADCLQQELDRRHLRYRVVNQGISGDTTSGGVARTAAAVSLRPKVVILELGANDGLRGVPVDVSRENLTEMITTFQNARAQVLLCGMTLPRNYGPDYIRSFEKVFTGLAHEKKVPLMPFFLADVATVPQLMQADAMHPNADGARRVAANVIRYLAPLLDSGR